MSGDDLTRLFEACLAREAVDPGRPQFAELWAAWLAFVGTPVGGPGVPDGEESVAFQTEPNEPEDDDLIADVKPGTRVFATRGWDGRGSLLQLTVIAVFDRCSLTNSGDRALSMAWTPSPSGSKRSKARACLPRCGSAGPARSLTTWPSYDSE